jgi:hypothetical protein
LAVDVSDQMLLIVDPAIGAVLAAKAILHRVDSVLEEPRNGILDSGQIVGVDMVPPEGWVLQVFRWRIAEYVDDIVADKGRSEIVGGLEAVDDRR